VTSEKLLRERQLWIAVVAVLVTAAGWLALVNAALLVHAMAPRLDGWMIAVRVLAHAVAALSGFAVPFAAAVAAGVLVIGWIARGARPSAPGGAQRV
jgi:hypothetical protein